MKQKPLNLKKVLSIMGTITGIGIIAYVLLYLLSCEQIHMSDYLNHNTGDLDAI